MNKALMKKILHWGGSLLAVAGIAFVALRMRSYADSIDLSVYGFASYMILAACALVYGGAEFLLAKSWHFVLKFLNLHVNAVWALHTYGTSQLAKYVPGNIFHFAGRQALGMAKGLPGMPLLRSTVTELFVQLAAGAFFAFMALPGYFAWISPLMALFLFIIASAIACLLIRKLFGRFMVFAFLSDIGFLLISGLAFTVVLQLSLGGSLPDNIDRLTVCGAFVIAWLAGFVVPGAPAGAGVRELVLLFFLKGKVPEAELLLAVIVSRAVTVAGDVIMYALSAFLAVSNWSKHPDAAPGRDTL